MRASAIPSQHWSGWSYLGLAQVRACRIDPGRGDIPAAGTQQSSGSYPRQRPASVLNPGPVHVEIPGQRLQPARRGFRFDDGVRAGVPGCLAEVAEHRRAPRGIDVPYPFAADPVRDDRRVVPTEDEALDV